MFKRIAHFGIILTSLCALSTPAQTVENQAPLYDFHAIDPLKLPGAPPTLPDLELYTFNNMIAKIPALDFESAEVVTTPFTPTSHTQKFTEAAHKNIFAKRQEVKTPLVLMIKSGVLDLPTLLRLAPTGTITSPEPDVYTLHLPLVIGPEATLVMRNRERRETLRLSSDRATFIANAGTLFVINTHIVGWQESKNAPHLFEDKDVYRPFMASWHRAKMYVGRSKIESLGYANTKSYGFLYSVNAFKEGKLKPEEEPTGWVVENEFYDMYYGFYCYEARDIAIIGNKYIDSIVYGVDPHDRSNGLIIAGNEAHGTKEKHGFIISREVNNSFIFDNFSHHNRGSGFMLDRSSVGNIVYRNRSFNNGADGMTLFESSDNLILENDLSFNRRDGLRIRNSSNIQAYGNVIRNNQKLGVNLHRLRLEKPNSKRNFLRDPYTFRADMTLVGGQIQNNKSGSIGLSNANGIKIGDLLFSDHDRIFRSDLEPMERKLKKMLRDGISDLEIRLKH